MRLFDPENVTGNPKLLNATDRFVVMYHGIFSKNRGLQNVIKAISILRDDFPELLFLMLGKGSGKDEFIRLVDKLGVNDNVLIHDPVEFKEVPDFVKNSDIGILPFPDLEWWNTSGPLKLGEYLSKAKPVIITDIAAHMAVVGDARCGIYAKDNRPETLANCIRHAISQRSNLPSLGLEGREKAIHNLSWSRQAETIRKYFECLSNKSVL